MSAEKRYIGVDIGGTFIKIGIVSGTGEISMRREVAIDRSGSETVMQTLMRGIDELLRESNLGASAFGGIGVSSAGCIDSKHGKIAINGGNVPDWSKTSVTGPLMNKYGIPATIANDGNCVALAEDWIGAAAGLTDAICVVLGTGVGGGIISDGRLIEGKHGYGGEIGHFPTHAEMGMSGIEWNSHYESFASTGALVRRTSETSANWRNGREIFEAAGGGDAEARRILDEWIDEIAMGIAGFVHVFDPEVVIIGGGVSAQEDLLIKPLSARVKSMVMPDFSGVEVKAATLGNNAGMAGAVKYLIDHSEK
ncbi:MAG: ROK family protein [Mogibacterium sp.]|nr:ROK family protein [Mogibacterium sp.]